MNFIIQLLGNILKKYIFKIPKINLKKVFEKQFIINDLFKGYFFCQFY